MRLALDRLTRRYPVALCCAAALTMPLLTAGAATAQEGAAATGDLPRDLSPWGMYLTADWVVKAVLIGLLFASLVTWTVWLAKSIELIFAKRNIRRDLRTLSTSQSLADAARALAMTQTPVGDLVRAAILELQLSGEGMSRDGIRSRIASRFERAEASRSRRIIRGTGVLATIGATAPFVGLFGTVWGIMNSFIGISKAQTTTWPWSRRASPRRCWRPRLDWPRRSRRL